MPPRQEALLESMGQGMSRRAACRRLGISDSMPYYWAPKDPEFKAAWEAARARPRYRRVRVQGDWVGELVGDLEHQGLIGQDVSREELRTCLTRFFTDRQILKTGTMREVYNRSHFSRVDQARMVDEYIKLKADGATSIVLSRYLIEHRVSKQQIGRWCRIHRGKGALNVGPWLKGNSARRILEFLREARLKGPTTASDIACRLDMNVNTVYAHLLRMLKSGAVTRSMRGKCGVYQVSM